jgi:hypothetical protein
MSFLCCEKKPKIDERILLLLVFVGEIVAFIDEIVRALTNKEQKRTKEPKPQ